MSFHRRRAAALFAASLALGACSSTKITEAWHAPDAGQLNMKKILAVAMFKNATSRRTAEDALRANITRADYFYAGTAMDLKKIYESLRSRMVMEKKETEITSVFSAIAAAAVLLSATLSLLWFNRVL